MLLRQAELDAIRTGEIDLAFRRWERPRLRAGTLMRTAIGLVEVTKVERIAPARISDRQARRAGAADREVLLARLDRRNPAQPIFRIGLRFAGPDPRVALRENAQGARPHRVAGARLPPLATRPRCSKTVARSRSAQPIERPATISTHATALSKIGNNAPTRG